MALAPLGIQPPQTATEHRRYADYFRRNGLSRETVMKAVNLTFQRSEVYFRDLTTALIETKRFKPACGAGCAFCCHTMVSLLPPEAFFLAEHVETAFPPEESQAMIGRILDHDSRHRGKSGGRRFVEHAACPMLDPETWFCRVHAARPLTCRAMHSGDLKPCKEAWEQRDAYRPAPSHRLYFENTQAYYNAIAYTLEDLGLQMIPLEMNAALATIWSGERVFERWLAGEQVFDVTTTALTATNDAPPPNG